MIIAFQTLIYFRESLLTALDWLIPIWPYYKKWTSVKHSEVREDCDDDQVFADYDEDKGVVFYPPVYAQRYAAVVDCVMDDRWDGKIEKVVDFGYNDMGFIKYLKDVPGIKCILGVDIESLPFQCSSNLLNSDDFAPKRESPLQITLYQGNAADPDYRLIGCDAVVSIEMIEHMLPHDLERLVHTVFGFIKPQIAVFTTPNGDFNVLFKALEKNGLRRLDHFFEWTREQFHDWCSNIVARYPEYTVSCKGIGPGPAGTERFGCCSQLALFICKDYHKQKDLDLNCLALVANPPKQTDFDEMTDSWESPDPIMESNMLCAPDNTDSCAELQFSEKQSCTSILFASPDSSLHNIVHKDKVSQCNLDVERGKNFLMFDEEIFANNVLVPQRKIFTKVYEFEDVARRLNCTTLQVKQFSKTSQNLMARNKLDPLVRTREIVEEIRHMTKILNFNKNTYNQGSTEGANAWNNINWGDNAPYWNQYYKIVKEFDYPFETKSEECRTLDLISDEINRLIDVQDNQFAVDINKLEIPLDHLMQVVKHITDDVEKVIDLLQWNGYEIVDNVLIYSRLVVDCTSVGSQDEWQDNDALSDWDMTDVQSLSDGSTMLPDVTGRSVRRALDSKVKRLRSLLTSDEDITTELDRIVCRLMKIAFRTTKDHRTPPPAGWMQRKLLDLLSLTEKAIERRRKYLIENYPFKTVEYDHCDLNSIQYKTRNSDTANEIVDKYLMLSSDEHFAVKSEHYTEDNLSATSFEMEPFIEPTYGEVRLESVKSDSKEEIHLKVAQTWVDGDYNILSPTDDDYVVKSVVKNSDSETSNEVQYNDMQTSKKKQLVSDNQYIINRNITKSSKIKKHYFSKNKLIKKVSKKRSSSGQIDRNHNKKTEYLEYKSSYTLKNPQTRSKQFRNLQSTSSKPIPRTLIEMCYQDLTTEKSDKILYDENNTCPLNNVAATKESLFVDIVTEDLEETFALRRTIATEANQNSDDMECEAILERVISVTRDDSFKDDHIDTIESVNSEIIFLYDLNEPSTSKGIRHVRADAQCGTDILAICPTSSAVSSLINVCDTGIKFGDSFTNMGLSKKSVNFGTITDENNFYSDFLSTLKKHSLKIKDSDTYLNKTVECSTMTHDRFLVLDSEMSTSLQNKATLTTCISNVPKSRPPCLYNSSDAGVVQKVSLKKFNKPKLSYCGIHVHSYRDRQVSEDVVFQGEWQNKETKIIVKRNPCVQMKKTLKSKEKIIPYRQDKRVIKVAEKKSVHNQNIRQTKLKLEVTNAFNKQYVKNDNIPKNVGLNNNKHETKIVPKFFKSLKTSKSVRNIYATTNNPLTKCNILRKPNFSNKNIKNDNKSYSNNNKTKPIINSMKLNRTANFKKPQDVKDNIVSPLSLSKADNLTMFRNEQQTNLTYLVFRNEIENSRSVHSSSANSKALTNVSDIKNNYSPPSQNSSPHSSPNSIATVCVQPTTKTDRNKSNSKSPEKYYSGNISVEKIEKYINKTKNIKLLSQSSVSNENKENCPETSKKYKSNKKDVNKSSEVLVNDRNKNVFMLQVKSDSPPMIGQKKPGTITQPLLNNTMLLTSKNTHDKKILISPTSKKSYSHNRCESPVKSKDDTEEYCATEINNLTRSSTPISSMLEMASIDEEYYTNSYEKNTKHIKMSNSTINVAMQQLIEERLNFINELEYNDSDSETVILSRDNHDESINDSSSLISYKTVITHENTTNISGRDIEDALLNFSFESDYESKFTLETAPSTLPSEDTKLPSLRSSDFFCDQSEMDNTVVPQISSGTKAVRDIYERKDQHVLKNTNAGVLAVQVFSGYSMDEEPIAGDQLEYISLVDPETGNLALELARQATSEEIFVSVRSSDTYESCYVDDDFIPNWLFNVISTQQSAEIPEEVQMLPQDQEHVEPEHDVDDNVAEAPGADVGAGDGRGMHSDLSQDSSGRGTSISSSDVSSGGQSEAVLTNQSAFLGPDANIIPTDAITDVVPVVSSDTSFRTVETDNVTYSQDNRRRRRRIAASDADADVSSMETDAADSDN